MILNNNELSAVKDCLKRYIAFNKGYIYTYTICHWIELYNNDRFKTKREKKRMNYYINKLKEFEKLVQE